MKREKVGFALLLLGIIFAAPADVPVWFVGLALGLVGLGCVVSSK